MSFFNKKTASYVVIGLGRFGTSVARTLCENDQEVILIDKDPDRLRDLRTMTDYAYVIKHLSQQALEDVGVAECSTAIVCIGSAIDANILATLYCLNLKVPRVIAKANSEDQGQILKKLGAEVVYPEGDMGRRLANQLLNKKVIDYFSVSGNIDLAQIQIPSSFAGRHLEDLALRQKYGISIIAIETGGTTIEEIEPAYEFKPGDTIIVIGSNENIKRFENEFTD